MAWEVWLTFFGAAIAMLTSMRPSALARLGLAEPQRAHPRLSLIEIIGCWQWVIAVLIRLATGSATVATVTASSLMLGLVEGMGSGQVALVVLAVGAGSLFFSHVNDAGFWLVKEYFGMTVGQTIKTWSVMETVLSVVGLVLVLLLGLVI